MGPFGHIVTPGMDEVTTGSGMEQMKVFLIGFLP
jgi:hypothetical protein